MSFVKKGELHRTIIILQARTVKGKHRKHLLLPAYVVRREGNSFTLFVSPHLGGGTHIP